MALEAFDSMNATMARRLAEGVPAMPSHALFVLRPRTTSPAEGRAIDTKKLRQSSSAVASLIAQYCAMLR